MLQLATNSDVYFDNVWFDRYMVSRTF